MPTVTNTVRRPDATLATGRVTIDLAGENGVPIVGYVTASDYSFVGEYSADIVAGVWSVTLAANSLITPAGTRWRVIESVDGRFSEPRYLLVPNGAGPYLVEDILSEAPGALPDGALAAHLAAHPGNVTVKKAGTTVGTRGTFHFTDGTDITTTITDDPTNNEVDVSIALAGAFANFYQQDAQPTGAEDDLWIDTNDPRRPQYRHNGISWHEIALPVERIGVALSDETTTITTGTAKATIHMPFGMTLSEVRAEVNTASTSGLVTVDINEGAGAGTSILSTKLSIDANEEVSTTAATPAVISDNILADAARVTFDVDLAGTGAKGLKVWLIGYRTT